MTSIDAEPWVRYWGEVHDGGRRLQVEHAAADPIGRWLVADATALAADEIGIDPRTIHEEPDALLAAAREGLQTYASEADLPMAPDERHYEALPVHVTTVGRLEGVDTAMSDPVADANTLTTLDRADVVEEPRRRHEAVAVTYRCPIGHERTVLQPLRRAWTVEHCLEPDCRNDVVPDDTATRARPVVRFTVETPAGRRLPCVATGRTGIADEFERLASASALHLTGVSRLVVDDEGLVSPTYEVLAVEPA